MNALATLRSIRESRVTLVAVVAVTLLLDELLLTVVVPILPLVLLDECSQNGSTNGNLNDGSKARPTCSAAYKQGEVQGGNAGSDEDSVFTDCEKDVNMRLGLLMASQFVIRIVMSFFGSYLCDKLGYHLMTVCGCLLMLVSSTVYAIAESYIVYLIARILHGFAAIPTEVGGLSLLAYRFRDDDKKRGFVLGLGICGYAVGSMVGPSFAGVVSHYLGRRAPYIFVAVFLAFSLLSTIAIFERGVTTEAKEDSTAVFKLLMDPLILIPAGAFMIASLIFGLLEPSMPVWMTSTMTVEDWQLGVVFLPVGTAYILSSVVMGYFSYAIGRWLCCFLSLAVMAIVTIMIPFATSFRGLLAPMAVFGWCFGTLDTASCAIFNYLVETRHQGAYGGAAALSVVTFSAGLLVGPGLSAVLMNQIGFAWMLRGLGIVTMIFAPLCFYLRQADSAPSSAPRDDKEDERALILAPLKPRVATVRQT